MSPYTTSVRVICHDIDDQGETGLSPSMTFFSEVEYTHQTQEIAVSPIHSLCAPGQLALRGSWVTDAFLEAA